jgi:hypothetical protein
MEEIRIEIIEIVETFRPIHTRLNIKLDKFDKIIQNTKNEEKLKAVRAFMNKFKEHVDRSKKLSGLLRQSGIDEKMMMLNYPMLGLTDSREYRMVKLSDNKYRKAWYTCPLFKKRKKNEIQYPSESFDNSDSSESEGESVDVNTPEV